MNYEDSSFSSATIAVDGPIDLRFPLPMKYKDQWVGIIGAEYRIDDHWTIGLGYNYATNVVRRSHLFPIMPATIQHHLTTGLTYRRDNWWVGGGYVLGMRNTMHGSGTSGIPLGIDYGFSEVDHYQHSFFVGFGFTW